MKRMRTFLGIFVTSMAMLGCSASDTCIDSVKTQAFEEIDMNQAGNRNSYDSLSVATYLTKINGVYFINDCYHNQIIYHTELNPDLLSWNVLTSQAKYPHSIAGDEKVLLMDDTENDRVLVYQYEQGTFVQKQILEHIGMKPHFVQYDKERETFFVWSSITGELYCMKRNQENDEVYISQIKKLDELFGVYVRSFTILGDEIYFVSGHNNQKILRVNLDSFEILEEYEVTPEIAGMVQLMKIEDYFYLTVSTDAHENQDYATIIRTRDLHSLARGEYEDIYEQFGVDRGTPYYITKIEDTYYLSHHRTDQNLISFSVKDNQINGVKVLY